MGWLLSLFSGTRNSRDSLFSTGHLGPHPGPQGRGHRRSLAFSRLASGHSVSSVGGHLPHQTLTLALFLWGQWKGGGEKTMGSAAGAGHTGSRDRVQDGMQNVVRVAGGTVRGCDR